MYIYIYILMPYMECPGNTVYVFSLGAGQWLPKTSRSELGAGSWVSWWFSADVRRQQTVFQQSVPHQTAQAAQNRLFDVHLLQK